MKPFRTRETIMDGVESARTDIADAATSIKNAATLAIVVFALVGLVATLALIRTIPDPV